ncbi:uncharacterized protein LOC143553429 [Bidens hawaiensis]|uniref:uncharacterized protein LOC143553429 n=1 Tax=Bidens hawaiensis TaxID=980011 RepID=UPI00404B06C7
MTMIMTMYRKTYVKVTRALTKNKKLERLGSPTLTLKVKVTKTTIGKQKLKLKQKESISEEAISVTLQRYSHTTILTLLHEVAQLQDVKIDWHAIIKHTKTGITNPREYQMLWRHLAYCDPLLDNLDKDAQPVDDDSDLECELEAFPTVSSEASAEAAAYVKVLMASNAPSESCIEKGLVVEAPLIINVPRTKSKHPQVASSASGVNISVPVFVPTQLLPTAPAAEGLEVVNGCANTNFPPRRKRNPWTAAEDKELFAAVEKYGEGNWTLIVKSDFKGDRTASQLSQRWNIIKKRQNQPIAKTGTQPSEVQLAARRALNMALDNSGVDVSKPASSHGKTIPAQPTNVDQPPTSTTVTQNYDSALTGQKQQFPRSQPFPNRSIASGPDAVKAAAVAAGARIATQSAAAEILKQQQLKGAIHIKTTRPPPAPGAHMGPDYFRAPCSRVSPNTPWSNMSQSHPKVGPVAQLNQSTTCQDMNVSSEVTPSCSPNGPEPKPKIEPVQEDQVPVSNNPVASFCSKDQTKCES